MAKRKKSAKRRPSIKAQFGITTKQYNTLRDEAAKARARIKDFGKRADADAYFLPDTDEYLLASLLRRVKSGEKVGRIVKEVKNITAKKIQSGIPLQVETINEYSLSPSEKRRVSAAVSKANSAIRQARKDFDFAIDIMPEEFNAKRFVENIASKESLKEHLKGLELFTPENLIPTAVNDQGEAGTMAEYQYYTMILERENARRAKIREMTDPAQVSGYIIQQSDYDKRDIDLTKIVGREDRKRRAETWDDAQRIYRANRYLGNYLQGMEALETILVSNGLMNETIADRLSFIYETIAGLMNNEDAITYMTHRVPGVSIQSTYVDAAQAGASFKEIYQAWTEVYEMFG